jgi:hypothetical protein
MYKFVCNTPFKMYYVRSMKTKVNRELIDQWIKNAWPNGIYKLSEKSGIPVSSLSKIRLGTFVPRAQDRRKNLASVLGVKESELFPVGAGKSRAS